MIATGGFMPVCAAEETLSDFEIWKVEFKEKALNENVNAEFLEFILPQMELIPSVVESDKKQPEFISNFWTYTDNALSEARVKRALAMLEKHEKLLNGISKKYGVPKHYIVAFWALETNCGSFMGRTKTLNALTTLAYDKRRRTFFTRELITFLKIMDEQQSLDYSGSWAGAFGHFQFMPTTFYAYAVDGDGDGKINVIDNLADAFASAANYLKTMGWDEKTRWGREVKLTKKFDPKKIDGKEKTIKEWNDLGVIPVDNSKWRAGDMDVRANLIFPMGVKGPAFMVYKNFKVIMRWNRSQLYALSVGLLADRLSLKSKKIHTKRNHETITMDQIKEIQTKLTELGYYDEEADGMVGSKTREALRQYQVDNELPPDAFLSNKLYNKIMGLK
jgi:membrane-bound lytic murein transglycosylase B